jgi:hypothetical protein
MLARNYRSNEYPILFILHNLTLSYIIGSFFAVKHIILLNSPEHSHQIILTPISFEFLGNTGPKFLNYVLANHAIYDRHNCVGAIQQLRFHARQLRTVLLEIGRLSCHIT